MKKFITFLSFCILSLSIYGCDRNDDSLTREMKDTVYTTSKESYSEYKLFSCFGEDYKTCDLSNRVLENKKYFSSLSPKEAIAFVYDADLKDIHILGYSRDEDGVNMFVFEFGNDEIESSFDEHYKPDTFGSHDKEIKLARCLGSDPYYCLVNGDKIDDYHQQMSNSNLGIARNDEDYLTPTGLAAVDSGLPTSRVHVLGYAFKQSGEYYVVYYTTE